MTAAELREALDNWKGYPYRGTRKRVIEDAARLWLRILEGDEQLVEIEVQSVHPMSIECYDLPWQSIKSDWRYLLVPLGPVQPEEEE